MSRRLKKLRRDLERRRRQLEYEVRKTDSYKPVYASRSEEWDACEFPLDLDEREQSILERNEFFLFRSLVAICLFLMIGIVFKVDAPTLTPVRQFVSDAYEHEFQFATIAHWYEQHFGRPLALLPTADDTDEITEGEQDEIHYALPATGTIYEDFEENGKGIIVETEIGTKVEAIRGGYVISVGEDQEGSLGKTVVVQHYDGTESVYGMLDTIEVNIYDHIKAGTTIGTVSTDERGTKGIFYLGLKKNDDYIDPSDVLRFD